MTETPIMPAEAARAMQNICDNARYAALFDDEAEALLCRILGEHGFGVAVKIFQEQKKRYL